MPPVDGRAGLLASVAYLDTLRFRCDGVWVANLGFEGMTDPAARASWSSRRIELASGVYMSVERLAVQGVSYVKFDSQDWPGAPEGPPEWLELDLSRLDRPESHAYEQPDPARLATEVFPAVLTARRVDEWTISGTLDLTRAIGSPMVSEAAVADRGDAAAEVDFTATLDVGGRMSRFQIFVPATEDGPAETWETHYFDYGGPLNISAPDDALPAQPDVYRFFNG